MTELSFRTLHAPQRSVIRQAVCRRLIRVARKSSLPRRQTEAQNEPARGTPLGRLRRRTAHGCYLLSWPRMAPPGNSAL